MESKKGKKRIMTAIILLAVLAAFSFWIYWGNTSIQTTHISIRSEKVPASFDGFTIVQIADLHNTEFGDNQSWLLDAVKDASPDMIAVTGDLIDSRDTDIKKAMEFIHGAVKIAPVYYVTGNHESRISEYLQLEKQMAESGVVIVRSENTTIGRGGDFIRLLGLDDPDFTTKRDLSGYAGTVGTTLKNMAGESGQYTILLSHRPEPFDAYAANGIDLVLSGHAHGGQVRLPFVGGLVTSDQGLFPRYSEGVYENGKTKMVVSRGLGNSIFPVRINNRPELVVITLTGT